MIMPRRTRSQVPCQFSEACAIGANQFMKHDLEHGLKCVEVGGQEDFAITNPPAALSCLISSFASALLSVSETYPGLREALCLSTRLKLHGLWQEGNTGEVKFGALNRP
jgi:hypothetical protein